MCVSHHLSSRLPISQDGVCGLSCDSDYRGLKKRIMAIKLAQQGGNELANMSSDSEHEDPLPSRSGASKGVNSDGTNHRENADGDCAANAQDYPEKQQTDGNARETQIELEVLREDGLPNVGAILHSQCMHSIFLKTPSTPQDTPPAPPKQYPGVVILDFIPAPSESKEGRHRASQRGSQVLEKLRRRSSRCDYFFFWFTLCSGSMVYTSHSAMVYTPPSAYTFSTP